MKPIKIHADNARAIESALHEDMGTNEQRISAYYLRRGIFRGLQATVHMSSFNVDYHRGVFAQYEHLGDWLRKEADALWNIGVNVYS